MGARPQDRNRLRASLLKKSMHVSIYAHLYNIIHIWIFQKKKLIFFFEFNSLHVASNILEIATKVKDDTI